MPFEQEKGACFMLKGGVAYVLGDMCFLHYDMIAPFAARGGDTGEIDSAWIGGDFSVHTLSKTGGERAY